MAALIPPATPRELWYRNKPFRYTANFIVTMVCTEGLAAVAYYSPQHASILVTLLIAFVSAVILWWVVNLLQSYHESAAKYEQEFDQQIIRNNALNCEIDKLTLQFENLIENTAKTLDLYPPFRKLLDKGTRQKKLIGHFLKKCMGPALCIWDISDSDFYELVQEGIRDCHLWQGIHHGKLTDLQASFPYLKELNNASALNKVSLQRIVILSKDDARELENREIVEQFLKVTGYTPSYWIDEDTFFETARLSYIKGRLKFDDCALHDGEMLLLRQRDRRIAMLSYNRNHEPICQGIARVFEELNLQLEGLPNSGVKFTEIK